MNTAQLLTNLEHRGVVLHIVGDRLKWKAPRGALTELDRQALSAHKTEILAALAAELEADRADVLEWGECYAWPSVRVAPKREADFPLLTADLDELVIPGGRAAWSAWAATASASDLERVRMSACYWQEGERDEWPTTLRSEVSE